ncbi:SRPBCC family protein [Nocardioides mangrovicus]|uniref:SRPBCC family protein n=1 Tax=Nocardioides mangrovicus TaxID=2478913 RepID=A0A3L8P0E1_9ACTN|nr:SRPBCC family protein [Nocardioides mangrovicus]RLV48471.1 SRPBCC family protein [Nocardioides mangrovicus]
MTTVRRTIAATPEQVWDVLADGWLYPLWVVGASRMRDVDDQWPAAGAKLHHSVGAWPLLLDDETEVLESRPPTLLELRARAWPSGEAHVRIRLEAVAEQTHVALEEDAASGPARLVPAPLRAPGLHWRNVEALRRLAYLAERRR